MFYWQRVRRRSSREKLRVNTRVTISYTRIKLRLRKLSNSVDKFLSRILKTEVIVKGNSKMSNLRAHLLKHERNTPRWIASLQLLWNTVTFRLTRQKLRFEFNIYYFPNTNYELLIIHVLRRDLIGKWHETIASLWSPPPPLPALSSDLKFTVKYARYIHDR